MKFKLISVDGSYTGILNGNIFVSDSLTKEQLVRLTSEDVTAEEIIEIFNPKLSEIRESNRKVQSLVDVLLDSGLFEEKNGSYYRVGNPISVPKMLLEKYKKILEEYDMSPELDALDNFWLKCSLNPYKEVREGLYDFLTKCGFVITPKGNFIAYRNVNILREGNRELMKFVTDNYIRIKGQKKSPKNYWVHTATDNTYQLTKESDCISWITVGNLHDLYVDIDKLSETVYTYAYTGSKAGLGLNSKEIRIGVPYEMKDEFVDASTAECSAGIHFCSWDYLTQHSGYALGDVKMAVLVNPMKCRSFPTSYNSGKGRGVGVLPLGEISEPVFDASEFEDDYDVYTLEELNKLLQEVDSSNQVIHQLTFSEVSNQAYKTIDEYRSILESKNQSIYSELDDDGDYEEDYYDYEDEDDWDYEEEDDEY